VIRHARLPPDDVEMHRRNTSPQHIRRTAGKRASVDPSPLMRAQ
jgi:hypothetical protein